MKILTIPQSGSVAGQTSSRNRFGQYIRTRAIPVNPSTPFQSAVRARLAGNATAWRDLTDLQRDGWTSLGIQMGRQDSLGQYYDLTGAQAYASVNNNRLAAGDAVVSDAPALTTPNALATVTLTGAAGTPALSLAFTVSPLGGAERLFVYASPPRSAGRNFEADLRLLVVTAVAATTPQNILSAYTARFGSLIAGQRIFVAGATYEAGFLSLPQKTSAVIAA